MTLAERLTALRLARNVSLQTVADAVGVSKAHIWELEKGRADNPTMALLKSLATFYNVTVAHLVEEDAPEDPDPQLAGLFRLASQLGPEDRALVEDVMASMLKRSKAARNGG